MQARGERERPRHTQPRRDALQAVGGVELGILTGIDRVEPGHPDGDGQSEDGRGEDVGRVAQKLLASQGDPCRHRRQPEGHAEPDVGQHREPLCVAVAEQPGQHRHGEGHRQPVGEKEQRGRDECGT